MASPSESGYIYESKDDFTLSSDPSWINLDTLDEWFCSNEMSWTQKVPREDMLKMLSHSTSFAVYHTPSDSTSNSSTPHKMVAFSRLITDQVTTAYLADVIVQKDFRGRGFADWMMQAVNAQMDSQPHLRRLMLAVMSEEMGNFYGKRLGAKAFEDTAPKGTFMMSTLGRGSAWYGKC